MKPTDSPFWKGLMKVKEDFLSRGSFTVGNGEDTIFWEDTWLEKKFLAQQYPSIYSIVHRKNVSVANVLNQNPLNIMEAMATTSAAANAYSARWQEG
jgi:hypothetical protein